ncbi:F3F20.2 protein [Citrus sinensis]|nr:F3F20.2 protein [Citrus sinensis]
MLRNDEEAITAEQQKQPACSLTEVKEEEIQQLEDPKMETPRSQSHVQEQESSPVYAYAYGSACLERSTLTDDTMNSIIQKKGTLPSSSSSSSSKSNKKLSSSSSKSNKKLSSSSSSAQFAKSKSCSNGASNILRNLMKCGAVDTKNGVVVNVNRPPAALVESKPNTTRLSKSVNLPPAVLDTTGDNDGALNLICRGDQHQLGGSARFFVTTTSTWNNQHHPLYGARKSFDGTTSTTASNNKKKDGFAGPKPVSSAYHYNYKPVGGPTCSQCGKLFKPEKLQKHMKSCKGMKASSKSSTTAEPVSFEKTSSSSSGPPQSLRSTNLSPQPQSSGQEPSTSSSYLLTN